MPTVYRLVSSSNGLTNEEVRRERLAIVLADLELIDTEIRFRLLSRRLDFSALVRVGVRGDVPALTFRCSITEAATTCDVLRSESRKAGQPVPAVWTFRKVWSRVPDDAVLTAVVAGRVILNPAAFAAFGPA